MINATSQRPKPAPNNGNGLHDISGGQHEVRGFQHDDSGRQREASAYVAADLLPAVRELLKAQQYAADAGADAWNFAVEITRLAKLGLSSTDLRWLVCKGYVEHRREITRPEDDARQFRPEGSFRFCKRTCFVLAATGVSFARLILTGHCRLPDEAVETEKPPGQPRPPQPLVPSWHAERHELRLGGTLVKQFKWAAANQEMLLAAFEEEAWPPRIDDPLPPHPEQDSKRRLSDTIKCLNRKQTNHLLHFRGDGTGEGIIWQLIESPR